MHAAQPAVYYRLHAIGKSALAGIGLLAIPFRSRHYRKSVLPPNALQKLNLRIVQKGSRDFDARRSEEDLPHDVIAEMLADGVE